MRYYKYPDDFVFEDGTTYLEEDDGCTFRQITVSGQRCIASNINYSQLGFVLPDQSVNYNDIEEVISITKAEFDAVWIAHLTVSNHQWELVKKLHPVGSNACGAILILYPQGVILGLNRALRPLSVAMCFARAAIHCVVPVKNRDISVANE